MLEVIRQLGCLQLDPISVVAPSHLLVLWSRLGPYDRGVLDRLLWRDHALFEYWAHAASIVLTEDYPIHRVRMLRLRSNKGRWFPIGRSWLQANAGLRGYVLRELRRRGPLRSRDLEDRSEVEWRSSGWTSGRNVDRMLSMLWVRGEIMVAGRAGGQKLWDLGERVLPRTAGAVRIGPTEAVRRAAQRSLRALGVATQRQIDFHFTRADYPGLAGVLASLEREGRIVQVRITDAGRALAGRWFMHSDDLPLLEAIEGGEWQPRTVLLSPFDNLICDRARTVALFAFDFRLEIYVPPDKRRHGYYVLSVLDGDRFIGRIDAAVDREKGRVAVHSLHTEPGVSKRELERAIETPLAELSAFVLATGPRSPARPSAARTSGSSR